MSKAGSPSLSQVVQVLQLTSVLRNVSTLRLLFLLVSDSFFSKTLKCFTTVSDLHPWNEYEDKNHILFTWSNGQRLNESLKVSREGLQKAQLDSVML